MEEVNNTLPNIPAYSILIFSIPNAPVPISNFIIWYISFSIISFFFFMGTIRENVNGFGKYILIRNYSKTKFILNLIFKVIIKILGMLAISIFVFYLYGNFMNINSVSMHMDALILKAMLLNILTIIGLILFQLVLELYFFSPITSLLINNIYVVISIAAWTYLHYIFDGKFLLYLGIANFMTALRTSPFFTENFVINQSFALIIIFIIICFLILVAIKRIRKIDIY
jgi:hypothetical protein